MSAAATALLALEQQVQAKIAAQVATISSHLSAYLGSVTRAGTHPTATDMLSRPDVHSAITAVLEGARTKISEVIEGGFTAAASLGRLTTAAELHGLGYRPPLQAPASSGYVESVIADVTRAFHTALPDIQNQVRAAYDGVTGDAAPAARVLTVNQAITGAVTRLSGRLVAAGTVAVNRGYTDAQLSLYSDYATTHTGTVAKRWKVTSANPCAACAALDGSTVIISQPFDHTATVDPLAANPGVYRDLQGPPRHPNCRCRLVADTTASADR